MISPEGARDIAVGVIRTWYANPEAVTIPGTGSLRASAERQRGGPIAWAALKPGPRLPFFAESHLQPVPISAGTPAVRHFGPHFLVPFYDGAQPAVVVAVAAYATNVALADQHFIRRLDPTDGGGEFRVTGIPMELGEVTMPPAPERAVEFVYNETGVKVTEVPVLGVPGNRVVRTQARWQLELASPVPFTTLVDGRRVEASEIFVGVTGSITDARLGGGWSLGPTELRMFVAAADQPEFEDVEGAMVPLRQGYAVDLHEVRVRTSR